MKLIRFAAILLLLSALLMGCTNPNQTTPPQSTSNSTSTPDKPDTPPAKTLYEKHGRLTSNASEALILWTDWTATVREDDSVTVTLKIGITCWKISVGEKKDAVAIVNGDVQTFNSPIVVNTKGEKLNFTFADQLVFETELEDDGTLELDIRIVWPFGEKHDNVLIEKLTIKDTVLLPEGTVKDAPVAQEVE